MKMSSVVIVGEFIHEDFYVDDGLKSLPMEENATDLIHRTKELCHKGRS